MISATASNITAPTKFHLVGTETYAYRRFGSASVRPLIFLQHFMGTLENWDFAVTDPLASEREVILFDNSDVGALGEFVRSLAHRIARFPAVARHALRERVNTITLAASDDFRRDSDLFGVRREKLISIYR
jgi:hypothetical protein